ncbi:transcription termination/antitermination protein NusG [Oceanivirga miroungae]|uniref:Transcription termination/antitermination protein NusG n=1 Tax=Oceanivirga miroungae TaxID=1130046 RepID=A0A6I8MD65_9FUSO|nr:transcription termination/antitermination NusG family protein [Oceanivirga miroungae]VWL85442.1 NusG antitermination factor [Oceanivirga miroungae]
MIGKREKRWFLIHTYSGYEKKVKLDLEKRVESLGLGDRVFRIIVPEEEVEEEKRGKLVKVLRKIYPSYVMVEMNCEEEIVEGNGLIYRVDSEAWYIIRNTNGVTGFLGVGSDQIPMTNEEVERVFKMMSNEKLDINIEFNVGDSVLIKEGAFEGEYGKVLEIDRKTGNVKVEVSTLGRNLPIEINAKNLEI